MSKERAAMSKLPALLTPGAPNGTGTGYKQTKQETSPHDSRAKEPQGHLPQLAKPEEADETHGEGPVRSTSKGSLDQFLLELVDPYSKGLVRFIDFAWLHVRLMYYNGQNTSIQERLQSLGGVYPQQVFRKYDIDQDNHLDKAEWHEYSTSLIAVLGKAYLKDACKGLLREQHEQEARKVAGPFTWRYDDQASRQLLEKVSCAQHLGRDQEEVVEGLLKKFADPNYGDRQGQTVLWYAATKCDAHSGPDLDSPVLAAARARKLQVLRLLLLNELVLEQPGLCGMLGEVAAQNRSNRPAGRPTRQPWTNRTSCFRLAFMPGVRGFSAHPAPPPPPPNVNANDLHSAPTPTLNLDELNESEQFEEDGGRTVRDHRVTVFVKLASYGLVPECCGLSATPEEAATMCRYVEFKGDASAMELENVMRRGFCAS
eukprot:g3741.t1